MDITGPARGAAPTPAAQDAVLWRKAEELEATFLAELLGQAGLGDTGGAFSGGAGEEQFASFLRAEQARLIVERGGIGLAETLFRSLQQGGGSGA